MRNFLKNTFGWGHMYPAGRGRKQHCLWAAGRIGAPWWAYFPRCGDQAVGCAAVMGLGGSRFVMLCLKPPLWPFRSPTGSEGFRAPHSPLLLLLSSKVLPHWGPCGLWILLWANLYLRRALSLYRCPHLCDLTLCLLLRLPPAGW